MDENSPRPVQVNIPVTAFQALLIFAVGLLLIVWWMNTPPGLLGKADAAGYAVCHRISERSFMIGDRQMPLCARCSGMFLGALIGTVYYLRRSGRRAGMPPLSISILLGAFLVLFAVDGGNSYLHFFPGFTGLYEPNNTIRLITGTGVGLGIASILVPVVNQTYWRSYDNRPVLERFGQFIPLLVVAGLVDLAVLSEIPLLLYPLALLSAGGILLVLSLVYSLVWILLSKQENRFDRPRELWVMLLVGFFTALLQIAVIDAGRFWLTGTWGGFNF